MKTENIKELCTRFYFWWHNNPGSNTYQGFDSWWEKEGEAIANQFKSQQDSKEVTEDRCENCGSTDFKMDNGAVYACNNCGEC